jgi:Domain of unknown function (DUF5122) beta-propeller
MKRAALLLLTLAAGSVLAGPLAVRSTDGTRWRIDDDDDPVAVERSLPSGQRDASFGRNGRADLDFGGREVDVTALRVDTTGRVWVAGNALSAGMSGALVQRLQPNGQLDAGWAVGGRSTAAPAGQRVVVADVLPMPDGSVWVAGTLIGTQGERDAALWRLRADGAMDYGFGSGGVWRRTGPERSEAQTLAAGPNGHVALGLELLSGTAPGRQVQEWAPGDRQPRLVPPATQDDQEDDDEAWILWNGRGWAWRPGPQVAQVTGLPAVHAGAVPAAAPQPAAPTDDGHTALNPFAQADAASAPVSFEPTVDELPWGWLLAALAGVGALLFFWRRGAHKG